MKQPDDISDLGTSTTPTQESVASTSFSEVGIVSRRRLPTGRYGVTPDLDLRYERMKCGGEQ